DRAVDGLGREVAGQRRGAQVEVAIGINDVGGGAVKADGAAEGVGDVVQRDVGRGGEIRRAIHVQRAGLGDRAVDGFGREVAGQGGGTQVEAAVGIDDVGGGAVTADGAAEG